MSVRGPRLEFAVGAFLLLAVAFAAADTYVVVLALTDMMRGRPAVYATFSSYDEVAHHSGLERADTGMLAALALTARWHVRGGLRVMFAAGLFAGAAVLVKQSGYDGGLAAGMAFPTTLALITALWSGPERTKSIALWSALGGGAGGTGRDRSNHAPPISRYRASS